MIDFSLLNKNFEFKKLYRRDYIKVHTVYNQEFEEFSKSLYSLNKKLAAFKNDDTNLIKFFSFYWSFLKICNRLPISFKDITTVLEKKIFYSDSIKKILFSSYPGQKDNFEFIIKKYNNFKASDINLFANKNTNFINNKLNLALNDTNFTLSEKYKFIKSISFFTKSYNHKLESISLFNPDVSLLQLIAYLEVANFVNVYNFSWINKNYNNLNFFLSNKNINNKLLEVKYIESVKPQYYIVNELKGEIFEEDLSLSTDLNDIIAKIENENLESNKIKDQDIKNKNNFDTIRSTLFQLSNGKIAFLRNESTFDQVQDVITKSFLGKIEVQSKKVDLIKPGEFVLFKGSRATSMLEKETSLTNENANIFYSQRKDWKDRLFQEINKLGIKKTIKKIEEFGGRKNISLTNIKYWLYEKSLRTDDKETFLAIMKLCGLSNKSHEIWINMGILEKAHMQSGRIIKNKIKELITKSDPIHLLNTGYQEYSLDQKGQDGGGSLEAYKIVAKGKNIKVKFSLTDKPMSPLDV